MTDGAVWLLSCESSYLWCRQVCEATGDMSEDVPQLYACRLCSCIRMCAGNRGRERWREKGVLMIIWEGVCVCDRILRQQTNTQSAWKFKSLQWVHINQFNGTIPASEVYIPNPIHNLLAFESLPLPPGWQVVHWDLIESIYILHKWKAHGGPSTWFWSATELGEARSSESAQCQQGIHSPVKEGRGGGGEHLFILRLALI